MNTQWKWSLPISPVRAAHVLGLAAVAVGVCFWADKLLQLRPAAVPAEKAAAALPADPAAQTVAAWLGPGQVRVNVSVIGLMYRSERAVAVLAINGARPKAFVQGETLMRNVTLASIDSDSVTIDHDGVATRFAAPSRPEYGPPGILRRP